MNEKLQYAKMLEIPTCTSSVTFKPSKKRKRFFRGVASEQPKEMLIDKVNSSIADGENLSQETLNQETFNQDVFEQSNPLVQTNNSQEFSEQTELQTEEVVLDVENEDTTDFVKVTRTDKIKKKFKLKFSVIGVQVAVIIALLATIFITNTVMPNSAINTFLNGGAVTQTSTTEDVRLYSDFDPSLPTETTNGVSVNEGIMSFSNSGSLYSPCDGKITSVLKAEDGTYTLEITHSENFKTVFTGLNFAYASVGDSVYSNLPVGYVAGDGAKMCFFDGENQTITDYELKDNDIKWVV